MITRLQNVLRAVRDWQVRQQAIQELASLNDHQLADIGVERGSLEAAVHGRIARPRVS